MDIRSFLQYKLIYFFGFILILSCDTGVEPSPEPGLLRVNLMADKADSSIVISGDTLYASPGDSMEIIIFQGRAYNDSNYVILLKNRDQAVAEDHRYNLLRRNNSGDYKKYTIFEYYVPPKSYNKLQFGISSKFLLLTYGYAVGGTGVHVKNKPDENNIEEFLINFDVNQGEITEINLQLEPFNSLTRHKDVFWFTPKFEVVSINKLGQF
jgi:hypothetical protein